MLKAAPHSSPRVINVDKNPAYPPTVEHFSSTTVHCEQCRTRTLRDGQTSYHHAGLDAVIAHPANYRLRLELHPERQTGLAQKPGEAIFRTPGKRTSKRTAADR